ncbi:MAG TPA: PEGA domain-containing protein, partial [Myxococcus sp.]|nr:PEGA domain-containing protein [Myxococcus sp.]
APPLSEAAPGTPEPLSALVGRCLARDSRDRPADGAALAVLLEDVVGRIAGPPADASRGFFQDPEASSARWREARFERLLSEGRALLARGEGARAARLLNEALTVRPGAAEVLALLRARPRAGRGRVLGAAALAGLVGVMAAWAWLSRREEASTSVAEARLEPPDMAAARHGPAPASAPPSMKEATPTLEAGPSAPAQALASATKQVVPAMEENPSAPAPTPASASPSTKQAAPTEEATQPEPAPASAPPTQQAAPTMGAPPLRTSRARPIGPTKSEPRRSDASASAASRPEPVAAPAPAAPRAEPAPAPVEAPRAGPEEHATLVVVTRPWAEVFVDGQSRGYTPRVREVRLSPGTHRLRFVNPLCDEVEEEVQVTAGQTLSREVKLQVRKAEVRITAPPGARVFLDGVELGVAPLGGPVNVEHGEHLVTARGAGGQVWRRELRVDAGARTEVVLGSEP